MNANCNEKAGFRCTVRLEKGENRKVLLLRGARQVGKTFIVRELAKEFNHFMEINFEKNNDIHSFFNQNLDPVRICTNLSAYYGIPIIEGKTLLFFDEIQSCSKALLHDSGIFQQIAGLRISDLIIAENIDMINKGSIAEAFAGLELIKYSHVYEKRQLYYWHWEKRGSSAELDYLIEQDGQVVPVEVKSGSTGKMQSMHLFIDEKETSMGIRLSLENFSQYGKITVIPLYAVSNLIQ